jgi:hypothetical protein
MRNTLYAHSAAFIYFTLHETFLHWLYPYYHDNDYPTTGFFLRKSPRAYTCTSIGTILSFLPL